MSQDESSADGARRGAVTAVDRTQPSSASRVSRRGLLKGAAVAGLSTLGIAANSGVAGAQQEYIDEYRSVVNIVQAGADDTGSESITPVLESIRDDNTLVYFPPGRYYMDSQFRYTNFEKFGVVGDDATLVPANYHDFDGPRFRLFRLGTRTNPGGHLRFEGLTVDQTAPETGIRAIDTNVTDTLEVHDITINGYHDSGTWGPARFNVVDPNGTGRVVDFHAIDGAAWLQNTPHAGTIDARGPIGIAANGNDGRLLFRRCRIGSFPGTGLYASNGSGRVVVHGGYFTNSDTASIRIGGSNGIVRWPTIEIDETPPENTGQRGIRIEHGSATVRGAVIRNTSPQSNSHAIAVMNNSTGARIEDTTIEIEGDRVNHGIVVSPDAGETVIEDTEIEHNTAGGYPIWIRGADGSDPVRCTSVTVSGTSGDAAGFRDGIRCGRDSCSFESLEVEQAARDGAVRNAFVNTGDGSTIYSGVYRASDFPFVELGSETFYARTDAASYTDGHPAMHLYDQSEDIQLVLNQLENGIQNDGSEGLITIANQY